MNFSPAQYITIENIKIGNTAFFNRSWFEKGICFINDLVKNDGNFYSQIELNTIYNININFLQYFGLTKAIKKWENNLRLELQRKDTNAFNAKVH